MAWGCCVHVLLSLIESITSALSKPGPCVHFEHAESPICSETLLILSNLSKDELSVHASVSSIVLRTNSASANAGGQANKHNRAVGRKLYVVSCQNSVNNIQRIQARERQRTTRYGSCSCQRECECPLCCYVLALASEFRESDPLVWAM